MSVWFISYSLHVTSFILHIPHSTCIDHSLTHQFFAVFSVLLFSFLLHQLAKFLSKQLRSYGSGKKEITETMYVLLSLTHSQSLQLHVLPCYGAAAFICTPWCYCQSDFDRVHYLSMSTNLPFLFIFLFIFIADYRHCCSISSTAPADISKKSVSLIFIRNRLSWWQEELSDSY